MNSIKWEDFESWYLQGYELIDIREKQETNLGIVPGAILIPSSEISNNPNLIDKNKKYMIYCATGNRSKFLIQQLINFGYKKDNLINIETGYIGWMNSFAN